MEIFIDPRAGSNKLIDKFPGECTEQTLEFGDVAFFGNGPDNNVWYIGIEYKTVNDVVDCIKSGRFMAAQFPGMLDLYDVCILLVEGIVRPNPQTGQLMRYAGKNNSFSMGVSYKQFDNFLTSVGVFGTLAGKPCMVKMAGNVLETTSIIRDLHAYFTKPWEDHTSARKPNLVKSQSVSHDLMLLRPPEPGNPDYPKFVLRKTFFQIRGVGWDVAGKLADTFGTLELTLAASRRDFEAVDRVGKELARRMFIALHGYDDPNYAKRKKKETVDNLAAV